MSGHGGARPARRVAALALLLALVGCGGDEGSPGAAASSGDGERGGRCAPAAPEQLVPEVVRTLDHDPDAYTQGLVVHEGRWFESTGLRGGSSIRELDPATGEVLRSTPLDDEVFGEGLAVGEGERLVQLTWTEGIAYERDADSFDEVRRFRYEGEGWGLTTLGDGRLVMSDGSDTLVTRDPSDFSELGSVAVRRDEAPADLLNELDFDGESIWANRYRTDEVLRIDPTCATVTGVLDVSELAEDARAAAAPGDPEPEVSNGIAHLPGTDRYLVTGKRWPRLYEVELRPA